MIIISSGLSLSSIAHTPPTDIEGQSAYERMGHEVNAFEDPFSDSTDTLSLADSNSSVLEQEVASMIQLVNEEDNPFAAINSNPYVEMENIRSPFYRSDLESELPDHYSAWLSELKVDVFGGGECDEFYAAAYLEQFNPAKYTCDVPNESVEAHERQDTSTAMTFDEVGQLDETTAQASELNVEAQELLSLRDQFISHFRDNKTLIARDRNSACGQLERFDINWGRAQFRIAIAKACLLSDRDARERLRTFFEQTQALLLNAS